MLELIDLSKLLLAQSREGAPRSEVRRWEHEGELAEEPAAVLQERGPRQGLKNKSQRMKRASSFQAKMHMFFSASLRQPCRPQQVWSRFNFNF